MSEFDSIEEELKFMADCSDDRGDSETSLMFVRYLAHIRKLNAELAALKAGQGEAVAWADPLQLAALLRDCSASCAVWNSPGRSRVPLYAAPPASADARLVPVELLERVVSQFEDDCKSFSYDIDDIRALLAQSQE